MASGPSTVLDQSAAAVPVTAADPQLGPADAPVTVVEFSDFQCPFCARVNPTLKAILASYGDRVRLVWKHNPLPFHMQARPAHVASAAVFELGGSAAFFRFHEQAFAHQQELTPEKFEIWAVNAGLKLEQFRARLASAEAKVDADLQLAQRVGARGTPNFFINGVVVQGAQPIDKFKEVIDAELRETTALMERGTQRADLYVARTNANFVPPERTPPPTTAAAEEDSAPWKVPVLPDDPVLGPAGALVTIVEFSDYQCPFCKRVEETLAKVREKYREDVRFVWKDNPLPFHERALPAALLARQAFVRRGNKAFWAVHDELFESNPKLEKEDLQSIAAKHGLAWNESAALADARAKERLEASSDLASELKARGTPHFFINGVRLSGAQPFEKFTELIDAELAKARALVAKGVPRSRLYDALQKDAQTPPPPERKEVAVPAASPFRGPAKAKVVIQEFSDFQCPFCKRVQPTLAELEQAFPGQIQLVWRHLPLPFHQDAEPAAEAAEEVRVQLGNKAFWAYHDKLFTSQGTDAGLSRDNLIELARSLGADADKLSAALADGRHRARVQADADAASSAGLNGTPSFLINGYVLTGAQPISAFKKAVRFALGQRRSP